MTRPVNVVIVEDNSADVDLCVRELRRAGFDVAHVVVDAEPDLRKVLSRKDWDVILSDYTLPHFNAMRALQVARDQCPEVPFIIVSGTLDEESAVNCLKQGANNYVLKSNLARLGPAVEQSLRMRAERRQQRLLRAQLREAQKMEAIGQLASGIAHDFNNLLTAIQGYLQIAREHTATGRPLEEALSGIARACENGMELTRSLLRFSRRGEAVYAPLDVVQLVEASARLFRHILPASIEIDTRLPEGRKVWVHGDVTQLQQVLMNRAVNARDAMPRGGTLTLSVSAPAAVDTLAPERSAGGRAPRPEVLLTVEDTGIGMSENVRRHAFDPFFTTKPRGEGTGLGLPMAQGIILDHGGMLEVESRPGKGTRFLIRLPAWSPICEPPASKAVPDPIQARVLLISTDRQLRAIMAETLISLGCRVAQVDNTHHAQALCGTGNAPYDLVVVDAGHPPGSGDPIDDILHHAGPCPVILLQGAGPARDISAVKNVHPLNRPFTMGDLLCAVRCVLKRPDDPRG